MDYTLSLFPYALPYAWLPCNKATGKRIVLNLFLAIMAKILIVTVLLSLNISPSTFFSLYIFMKQLPAGPLRQNVPIESMGRKVLL